MQGTVLKRSTAYHPQTDGQTEVVNRSVETYLRCFVSDTPKLWAKWLAWAEYWYNTSFHTAAQTTPFKILYGRDPPHLIHYGQSTTPVSSVDQYLEERDRILAELKGHLLRAQQLMKKKADEQRREVQFKPGDRVYLKLRPYRQKTLARRRNEKLSPRYFGPYEVTERIGAVAYRLRLPASSSIHPVFHVSQLRRAIGDHTPSSSLPATLTEDMEMILEPMEVVGVRQGTTRAREVLVRWKDLPDYEATWESYEVIKKQFPSFHLEDKVLVWEGSIVTESAPLGPPPLRYEKPSLGHEEPLLGYERSSLGHEKPSLGHEEPLLGYERSSLGYEKSPLEHEKPHLGPSTPLITYHRRKC